LVVFRRLPDFVERAKVSTWIFRICMRVAKDHRRRAHVRREVLDDSSFDLQTDGRESAAEMAERQEDLALFDAALARLDLEQRAVFILFELENMSGEQVADTLEIPLGTVYSRLRRGRVTFKQAVLQLTARQSHRAHLVGAT
jgi:RNA polymerase sigma-70 factor (ECF subfamily)